MAVLGLANPAAAVTAWTTVGFDRVDGLTQSQGVASIIRADGTQLRYTGVGTIRFRYG